MAMRRTLYNQNFAVVRDRIVLDLKEGETRLEFSEITAYAEPDSVILRDLSGKNNLRILEQNYRADPVSQDLLLSHFEGQEIEFLSNTNIVKGTIVRGGNLGTITYSYSQQAIREDPIIEVDGQLRFSLPGQPLFPSLGDDSILKPTFNWLLHSERSGKADAELCYVSGGLNWAADYNIVAPEKGNRVDLIGERIRTDYQINTSENWIDESFEIKLRNRKENETVEIRIVEHLYRALSWTIVEQSDIHLKTDAKTMELRVQVAPGEEKIITYKVHYTW